MYDGRGMKTGLREPLDLKPLDPAILARDVREWIRYAESCSRETPEFCWPESLIDRVRQNLRRSQGGSEVP
jgi:hypothetical protein